MYPRQTRVIYGFIATVIAIGVVLLMVTTLHTVAQEPLLSVQEVRTLYPSEWGVPYPAGLSYSLAHDQLALVGQRPSAEPPAVETTIVVITPYEDLIGAATLSVVVEDAINIAYDDQASHLLLLAGAQPDLIRVAIDEVGHPDAATWVSIGLAHLGLRDPVGMSVDAINRQLLILDGGSAEIVRADLDNGLALLSKIDLAFLGASTLRGLALHPINHHLFVLNQTEALLYELTDEGQLLHRYDLTPLALVSSGALAFGPSADLTDDPNRLHLFLADSALPDGAPSGSLGRILEVALDPAGNDHLRLISAQVASNNDDMEETLASGATNLDSSDLELIRGENGDQLVGIRFAAVAIPVDVTVTQAYIEFTADETGSEPTSLIFHGEAADNAAPLAEPNRDLSRRPVTSAVVTWPDVPAWSLIKEKHRTPDLAPIVQEIVDRGEWHSGNAIAFIISGSGKRTAEAYDQEPGLAPQLFVEYAEPTPTPYPTATPTVTMTPTAEHDVVRFAVIGDYGRNNTDEARVATLVAGWDPDFVITTGDNNYPDGEATTIDEAIGQYYSQFIGNYQGTYGSGSVNNRFWPSLGNHDWHTLTCTGDSCAGAYFDYFTLPHNERYYDVDLGLVHLFAVDSESEEPDGRDQNSPQALWLREQLALSAACYNLVYFHRAPYGSGRHGSHPIMAWPFAAWGAQAVFSGHDHLYERLAVAGIPYFVNGAGGAPLYSFDNIDNLPAEANSIIRYNEEYGAMLVTATQSNITYQFYNADGLLIDDYTVAKACADRSVTPTPTFVPTAMATTTATPTLVATVVPTQVIHVPDDASTIQAAIDRATDGDIVLVSPGEYHENIQIDGKTITLASQFYTTNDPGLIDQTVIDGDGNTVITVGSSVGPETAIIGFTIQNGEDGISPAAKLHILHNHIIGNRDGIDYEGGGGLCRNNVFDGNSDDAIDLDGATEVTIEDNLIRNSGDDGIEIRLQPYSGPTLDIIVRGNRISGNREDGIQLIGYDELTDRSFRIERNVIKNNVMAGLGLMDNQITNEDFRGAGLPEPIYLFSNTFVGNAYGLTGGHNLLALNNLFVRSPIVALKNVDGSSLVAHNLFWDNGANDQSSNVDTTTTLSADPRLDADEQLLAESPAIDAGAAFFEWNSAIVLDLQPGDYAGAAPDLGANEALIAPRGDTTDTPRSKINLLFLPTVLK